MSAESTIKKLLDLAAIVEEVDSLLEPENFEVKKLARYVVYRRRFAQELNLNLQPFIDTELLDLKMMKAEILR
jgi:hypothetical protein